MEAAAAELERELTLLGATAIEDRLQKVRRGVGGVGGGGGLQSLSHNPQPSPSQGVGDTIRTLNEAGIRVWVLTGDRMVSGWRETTRRHL